ncbi:hypothetical protein [Lysobacter gummosus]|uniref:hypothetical protein n=1 Tax=Lysobacter gummosus TaxID=262324 RepID=UPI0036263E5A
MAWELSLRAQRASVATRDHDPAYRTSPFEKGGLRGFALKSSSAPQRSSGLIFRHRLTIEMQPAFAL